MTRRRALKPETIIARLLRLGTLSEIDAVTGRRIAWSDDYGPLTSGRVHLKAAPRPEPRMPADEPPVSPEDETASVRAADQEPPFAAGEIATLDFLRDFGIVKGVETDPGRGAIRVRLSQPYRRLIEAGREPDREPGFDDAWIAGGPAGARAWLEEQARGLGPSAKTDEAGPWPCKGRRRPSGKDFDVPPVDYRGLRELIQELYAAEGQRFLDTPRRALGGRTPRQALRDGDIEAVWDVAIAGVVGDWK